MDWKKELFSKKDKKPDYRVALIFGVIVGIIGLVSGDYILSVIGVISIFSSLSSKNKKGQVEAIKMAEYFKGRDTGKYREIVEKVEVAQEEKREKKIKDNRTVLLVGGILLWAISLAVYLLLK
ncbi:MAG: hypothetical protein ABIA91_00620 [Patescibacteria group bacterium]